MKFFYFMMTATLFCSSISSQTKLDSMLVNIDKSTVTSGIIYERVTQFANLYNFNNPQYSNTATSKYFRQALSELHRASNETRLISLADFDSIIANTTQENQVDMAILNTPYHILNYNHENASSGGLILNPDTGLFQSISNQPAFFDLHTTIISPTKSILKGTEVIFKFSSDLYLTNGGNEIYSMTIDFGSGPNQVITNGNFNTQEIIVPYSSSGTKEFECQISFNDNTTLVTKGSFYFHFLSLNQSFDNLNGQCVINDPRAEDDFIIAEESFKGYNDNDPRIFPRINYRIFYADESHHTDLAIYKPVIIIDGFDPGDRRKIQDCDCEEDPICASNNLSNGAFDPERHRSMTDLMIYKNELDLPRRILDDLRFQGYDVILVNQPTYNTTDLDTGQTVTIDGGAYYIESNALALVSLIKHIKQQLSEVNSNEDISIVGPSMGGQISRYALAYMEKKFEETNDNDWDHHTKLWVSVDSPHLGANIPVGDQALVHLAATMGGSDSALDFYENQLGSVAAKQQLIEYHRDVPYLHAINENNLNGRVATQGFPTDDGSFYFRNYYNNLENNGIPGSQGYPENLRRIALVNGSLTGKTIGHNSEKVLNIRGFQRVEIDLFIGSIVFDVHIASLESYFMPSSGSGYQRVARFKAGFEDIKHKSPNINSRTNMDIVPGGWFAAQNDIAQSILGTSPINGVGGSFWEYPEDNIVYWLSNALGDSSFELYDFRPNHSFIASFSAIAHKQPDQSWLTPLNYNLVCTDETYFDSYFGHDENTQHTSFTLESAQWLFKELAGEPQYPNYPLNDDDLKGDSTFCLNQTRTFFFGSCKLPSHPTWYVSNNLDILEINNDNSSITVRAVANGPGHVSASLEDGRNFLKNIFVGPPDVFSIEVVKKLDTGLTDPITLESNCKDLAIKLDLGLSNGEILDIEWEQISDNFLWTFEDDGYAIISPLCNGPIFFRVRLKNDCGWSEWKTQKIEIDSCKNKCNSHGDGNISSDRFTIYPVPVDSELHIEINDEPFGLLENGETFVIKLFNSSGWLVFESEVVSTSTSIDVSDLSSGLYSLVIIYEGEVETHLIVIE